MGSRVHKERGVRGGWRKGKTTGTCLPDSTSEKASLESDDHWLDPFPLFMDGETGKGNFKNTGIGFFKRKAPQGGRGEENKRALRSEKIGDISFDLLGWFKLGEGGAGPRTERPLVNYRR